MRATLRPTFRLATVLIARSACRYRLGPAGVSLTPRRLMRLSGVQSQAAQRHLPRDSFLKRPSRWPMATRGHCYGHPRSDWPGGISNRVIAARGRARLGRSSTPQSATRRHLPNECHVPWSPPSVTRRATTLVSRVSAKPWASSCPLAEARGLSRRAATLGPAAFGSSLITHHSLLATHP